MVHPIEVIEEEEIKNIVTLQSRVVVGEPVVSETQKIVGAISVTGAPAIPIGSQPSGPSLGGGSGAGHQGASGSQTSNEVALSVALASTYHVNTASSSVPPPAAYSGAPASLAFSGLTPTFPPFGGPFTGGPAGGSIGGYGFPSAPGFGPSYPVPPAGSLASFPSLGGAYTQGYAPPYGAFPTYGGFPTTSMGFGAPVRY